MPEPLRVLALDPSFSGTGWATNCRTDEFLPYAVGVKEFPLKRGCSPGTRFIAFHHWLRQFVANYDPRIIVYEQAHHRGGAATAMGEGLACLIQMTAAEFEIEYRATHSATLKWFATGYGKSGKLSVVEAASQFTGRQITSYDEADAIILLAHALAGFPDAATEKAEEKRKKALLREQLRQARLDTMPAGRARKAPTPPVGSGTGKGAPKG